MRLFTSKLFNFVLLTTQQLKMDESHGIIHSMSTVNYAEQIYHSELSKQPKLINYHKIILAAAALHDLADNKYTNEIEGTKHIVNYLQSETDMQMEEIDAVKNIINTMSYSKVKKQGYPNLGRFQEAYHIVREADLLCAYDFERAIIYDMAKNNCTTSDAFENSYKLFIKRVFQYCNDNLFVHDYAKKEAHLLHSQSIKRIEVWRRILGYKPYDIL